MTNAHAEITQPEIADDSCPICGGGWESNVKDWIRRCGACGFLSSTLDVCIGTDAESADRIDETVRFIALKDLRLKNYRSIISKLRHYDVKAKSKVLDVGCAYGWFLDEAAAGGYKTFGVEPDAHVIKPAMKEAHTIWQGFFPSVVPGDIKFDAISFHDVFEHLPDVGSALDSCHERLEDEGVLVINLPNKNGVFYRIARAVAKFGFDKPLERLWQKDFPSPHLSYFTPDLLERLAVKHGFKEIGRDRLETLCGQGLWARIRYDKNMNVILASAIYLAAFVMIPVLKRLPADITVQYFKKA